MRDITTIHKALQEISLELSQPVKSMATQTDDRDDKLRFDNTDKFKPLPCEECGTNTLNHTDHFDKYPSLPFEACGTNILNHELDIDANDIQNLPAQDKPTDKATQIQVDTHMQTEDAVVCDLGQITELIAMNSSLQAELLARRQESLANTSSITDKYGKLLQAAFDEIEKQKAYIEFLNG